jgi:thiamine pyrophosphate-dependent acetolactate synthase large subunit-like protein
VVHIDIDEAEIGKLRRPAIASSPTRERRSARWKGGEGKRGGSRGRAGRTISALPARHGRRGSRSGPRGDGPADARAGHPVRFLAELSSLLSEDSIITTDVGQHQMGRPRP